MALNYRQLKSTQLPPCHQSLRPDDCVVYGLGVGAGLASPSDLGDETRFIYEERLQALPSQASVMAYPGFWMRDAAYGLDWQRMVNAELRLVLHGPLPTSGELTGHTVVSAIHDKGAGRGALVQTDRSIVNAAGQALAQVTQLSFCRGDGGYSGGDSTLSDALPPAIDQPPALAPRAQWVLAVGHQQAAIYRLTGDRNPLHIDPEAARAAGYPAPILHGAATAGMVCRVLVSLPEASRNPFLRAFQIRFTGVLFPGDALHVSLWNLPDGRIAFRCTAPRNNSTYDIAYGCAQWADDT